MGAGPLERARPDPQGAALRPLRTRGQPRRGRQGILLLPRRHADPLVHEDALQVSAGRVSLRAARRGVAAAEPRTSRSSSSSTRSATPSGRAAISTSSSSTPRPTRKTSSAGSRRSTAAPSRRRCTSCPTSGSATPGRGDTRTIGPRLRAVAAAIGPGRAQAPGRAVVVRSTSDPVATGSSVHRERDELRAALRRAQSRARTSRMRSTRPSSAAGATGSIPRASGNQGRGALPGDRRAGRVAGRPDPVRRPESR